MEQTWPRSLPIFLAATEPLPAALASRYQSLLDSQRATAVALAAFHQEVDLISGLHDPQIWIKVQEEMDRHREDRPTFTRGSELGWTAHLNASLQESLDFEQLCQSPLFDSPLFGAVDGPYPTNSFGAALEPLSAIPPLPELPSTCTSFLEDFSSYARSTSTSSSMPSAARSPYLSPFTSFSDLHLSNDLLGSPYSISPPTCPPIPLPSVNHAPFLPVDAEDLPALPSFASTRDSDIISQLEAILDSSITAPPASVQLARTASRSPRAPRRGSSGRDAPRFNPLGLTRVTSTSGIEPLSRSLPIAITTASAPSVASVAVQMSALSTDLSPSLAPTSPRLRPSDALSRSGSTKKRAPRTIVVPETVAVTKNPQHLFAVHVQSKTKVEVSETTVIPLVLSDETDPGQPLATCVKLGVEYSPVLFRQDCQARSSYTFFSNEGSVTWTVRFSQFGPQILPSLPSPALHTFIHFAPGEIDTTYPLGSRSWWRLQECQQHHAGFPGNGHWTARYDGENQEKRRPIRIIQHFASCPSARVDEYGGPASWSLGKLARSILEVLPSV